MHRALARVLHGALALAGLTVVGEASADWPMARHDPQRTGLATGTSNITSPIVTWRYYLGGKLDTAQLVATDLDGDGAPEVAHVADGSLRAHAVTGSLRWATENLAFDALYGPFDFDGDGEPELMARSPGQVHIVSAHGDVVWSSPQGLLGPIAALRVGDLTGDGRDDLLVTECGCCAGRTGEWGFAYSFSAGYSAATTLWQLPVFECGSDRAVTIIEAAPSAAREVLLSTARTLRLYDGAGQQLAESPDLGAWTAISQCRPADLDGDGSEEAVCITNTSLAPDNRQVFALHYDGSPTLQVLWARILAPSDGDLYVTDPIVNLDDDGALEVIVSTKDSSGAWSTLVLDGLTGATRSVAPEKLQGVTSESGERLVLTGEEHTSAWRFPPLEPGGEMTLAWTLEGYVAPLERDPALRRRSYLGTRLVEPDHDLDGAPDLILFSVDTPVSMRAVSYQSGTPETLLEQVASGTDMASCWTLPSTPGYPGGSVTSRTDGRVVITTSGPATMGPVVFRAGGYYAEGGWRDLTRTPVVAPLSADAPASVLVPDSRGALLRLDPGEASLAHPPTLRWERPKSSGPVVLSAAAGPPLIGALRTPAPGRTNLMVLDADGGTQWSVVASATPLLDLVPGDFNADGAPDLAFLWGAPTSLTMSVRAVDGTSGVTLWNSASVSPGSGRQPAGISVGQFAGDSIPDVYFEGPRATVLSGVDGTVLHSSDPRAAYGMLTLYDVEGDEAPEVTLHGSNAASGTFSSDFASTLWRAATELAYPYGAVAPCASGPRFVQGSWEFPSRLKLTEMSGATAGASSETFLAGGEQYPSEAAISNRSGQLTSVSVHSNLTGTGQPSAVVGSTDGWLYAVNPCTGVLDFALDLGAPVGAPVFGDTDGDGRDEVLTTVASGDLVAIRNEDIPAPDLVWDTDPTRGILYEDVDQVATIDSLSGRWNAVLGATSYEVSIVDAVGDFLTPARTNVGIALEATLTGLPLQAGSIYWFVVRALGPDGTSVDAMSDGVLVVAPTTGGGGAGGQPNGGSAGVAAGAGGVPVGAGGAAGTGGPAGGASAGQSSGGQTTAGNGGLTSAGNGGAGGLNAGGNGGLATAGQAGASGQAGTGGIGGAPNTGGAAAHPSTEPTGGSGEGASPQGQEVLLTGRACTCTLPQSSGDARGLAGVMVLFTWFIRRKSTPRARN